MAKAEEVRKDYFMQMESVIRQLEKNYFVDPKNGRTQSTGTGGTISWPRVN